MGPTPMCARPGIGINECEEYILGRKSKGRQMKDESPQIVEYFASDGASASFRLFAAADPDATVVICLPAMGVRGRYYSDFASLLSKSGFHVLTSDLRGIDSSSVRASRHCDFGYEEIINRDLPALVEAARLRFPSNDRLLLGHSLG